MSPPGSDLPPPDDLAFERYADRLRDAARWQRLGARALPKWALALGAVAIVGVVVLA